MISKKLWVLSLSIVILNLYTFYSTSLLDRQLLALSSQLHGPESSMAQQESRAALAFPTAQYDALRQNHLAILAEEYQQLHSVAQWAAEALQRFPPLDALRIPPELLQRVQLIEEFITDSSFQQSLLYQKQQQQQIQQQQEQQIQAQQQLPQVLLPQSGNNPGFSQQNINSNSDNMNSNINSEGESVHVSFPFVMPHHRMRDPYKMPAWLPTFPPPVSTSPFSIDLPSSVVDSIAALLESRESAGVPRAALRGDLHHWAKSYVYLRLHQLQNPSALSFPSPSPSGASLPRVAFSMNKACGFGCQLHHTTHCFKRAISIGATLVHQSATGWRFGAPRACLPGAANPWDCAFQPLSSPLSLVDSSAPFCPITESAKYGLEYFVPPQLHRLVALFHRDPPVWFAGVTEHFLLRPADTLQHALVQAVDAALAGPLPLVVVHVRRTDKVGTEASLHRFSEYHAEYAKMMRRDSPNGQLPAKYTLYLLSDEPRVAQEAREFFQQEMGGPIPEIRYNPASLASGSPTDRYEFRALQLLLEDLWVAQHADYFVGTFSSQISRIVYELMQITHVDPTEVVKSLDDGWYYG